MEIDVGSKIRDLRKNMNMKIADLSNKSGISSGMISQIENNKVIPTVVVMWKIANALEESVGYFFDEKEDCIVNPVVKENDRKKFFVGKSNRIYEMLVPDLKRKIEFLMITIKKDDEAGDDFLVHEGEECGYVLIGKMKIIVGDDVYLLEKGDSISFDSSVPHRYENAGDEDCVSIWAMTPPSF